MRCPKCESELEAARLPMNVTVDYCARCRGAFYDAQEIAVPLADGAAIERTCDCPKCGTAMLTADYFDGRLTLERCESCRGIWFDYGEVVRLKELARTEDVVRPAPTPAPGAQDAPAKDETLPILVGFLYDLAVELAMHSSRRRRRLF